MEETCGMEEGGRKFPHLTNLVNGDPNEERNEKERGRKMKDEGKKESFRERSSSTFSLNCPAIGARGKVHPCGKSFASRPELRSFDKLLGVGGFFLLCLISG